jgi:hypothetical protein
MLVSLVSLASPTGEHLGLEIAGVLSRDAA